MRPPVPAAIARRVLAWSGEPAPTRDAATVVLLRDGTVGLEVYLLVRVAAMAAFGGMTVFPGGGVDPADLAAADLPWHGPPPAAWPLAAGPALARALVCAAVRETFEECGVLLAGPGPDAVVIDAATEEWEAARRALEARTTSLSALLTARGLVLRADLLRAWSHWITPVQEARRYDTRFFVAALPAGQRTRDVTGEADRAVWMRPADAVAAAARGELTMVPPTVLTLTGLAGYATVADVWKAAESRVVEPVLPRLVADGPDSVRFVLPGDPGYGRPAGADPAGPGRTAGVDPAGPGRRTAQ